MIEHEQTKSRASRRTMFLIPETVPYLEKLRIDQIALRSRMGSQWQDKQEHVCVRKDSRPFLPDYVSQGFARLLKKYQLPPLRFHELRHTAGSLLLEHGMSAKQIQEYLGHEQVSTTLDIYTHLSTAGKAETAHTMGSIFRNM